MFRKSASSWPWKFTKLDAQLDLLEKLEAGKATKIADWSKKISRRMSPGFPICMILPTCRTWLLGFHILAKYDHHDWEGLGSPESSNSWHWQYWAIFGDNCSLFGDKLLKKVTGLCSLDWSTRKCSQPRLTITHMWPISQMAAKCQSVQPTFCCHPWLWKALWRLFDKGIYRQYLGTGCICSALARKIIF